MIVVKTPNQALQPTAGRSDVWLSDDFNVKFRSKACFRQRWLNLVSLDVLVTPKPTSKGGIVFCCFLIAFGLVVLWTGRANQQRHSVPGVGKAGWAHSSVQCYIAGALMCCAGAVGLYTAFERRQR